MGERRGASASERNARNINNFINKTTKLFFNICSHLQGANKQTNRKTHWGDVVGVCGRSKSAPVVWAGLGRVPFLWPAPFLVKSDTKEVGCHQHPAGVPGTMPAGSGLGQWWRGGCSWSAAPPGCRSRSLTPRSPRAAPGQPAVGTQLPERCFPWGLPADFPLGRGVGLGCCRASCLPGSLCLWVAGPPPCLEWWRALPRRGRAAS